MYICPFSGLVNGTLTITDYKLYFTSVERVLHIQLITYQLIYLHKPLLDPHKQGFVRVFV